MSADAARTELRATHNVRLVQPHEEGTAAADLPVGVYGFTGSPGLAAPLFATPRYRNFEVHHLAADVAIIGFVTPRDRTRLSQGSEAIDLTIFPDPEGEANEIVALGYSQIAQHRQYSIRNSAGLTLRIRPQIAA